MAKAEYESAPVRTESKPKNVKYWSIQNQEIQSTHLMKTSSDFV